MRKANLKVRILTLATLTATMLLVNASAALAKLPPIRVPEL